MNKFMVNSDRTWWCSHWRRCWAAATAGRCRNIRLWRQPKQPWEL